MSLIGCICWKTRFWCHDHLPGSTGALPSTRPISKVKDDALPRTPKLCAVSSLNMDLPAFLYIFFSSVALLFGIRCFLSKQKQVSMTPSKWLNVLWKCNTQCHLGAIESNPKVFDHNRKDFSSVSNIISGETATLGAERIRSTTSISVNNAKHALTQKTPIFKWTVWVNRTSTGARHNKSFAWLLIWRVFLCFSLRSSENSSSKSFAWVHYGNSHSEI